MAPTRDMMAEDVTLLDEMAHWTGIAGRMQQLLMEHGASAALKVVDDTAAILGENKKAGNELLETQAAWWKDAMAQWQSMLPVGGDVAAKATSDRRFRGARWEEPVFDMIRQSYVAV